MLRNAYQLLSCERGAVAPMIALSIFALIGAGGIAFDYARMASMDTELQSAADQAALAAASQLDGQPGACARAAAAASGMVANRTLMANDNGGNAVVVDNESACDGSGNIRFYQDKEKTTPADDDTNANFVEVFVNPREAFYALTPVVGALSSGQLTATAYAGLQNAVCKTPPVMICNPQETGGDTDFDLDSLIGVGLRLVQQGSGSGHWSPGDFGYLNNGSGVSGAPGVRQALGWINPPGECVSSTGVATQPGVLTTVTDAINTRLDIYENGQSCPAGGECPPSINAVKDVVRQVNSSACDYFPSMNGQNKGWQLDTTGTNGYYGQKLPTSVGALAQAVIFSSMGYPRDMCHAVSNTGNCSGGRIGNGAWDIDAYFRTNYRRPGTVPFWAKGNAAGSWKVNTGLPANAKRSDVYQWEIANRGKTIDGVTVLGSHVTSGTGNNARVSYGSPQCGTGTVPEGSVRDRRILSVAIVNCLDGNVSGNSTDITVKDWIDIFLVEPSLNRARTNAGDLYVEVIGRSKAATNEDMVQLVVKSVPYLIE